MTATERARRADALYFDTNSLHRRQLCEMVANRESDLEDVRATIRGYREQVVSLSGLVRDLERARRSLCDAYPESLGDDCNRCPACKVCDTDPISRMRELGVEL